MTTENDDVIPAKAGIQNTKGKLGYEKYILKT